MDVISTLGVAEFSTELLIVIAAWLGLAMFGYMFGVSRLNAIGLTVIITAFASQYIQGAWLIGTLISDASPVWIETLLITGVTATILYLIFMRLCDPGFSDSGNIISTAISALAVVFLLLATWSSAFMSVWPFPELLAPIFAPMYFLWWLIGSLIVLMIMHQKRLWK
jgi:hypothetical protein